MKKILVMGPALPEWSEIKSISETLIFFELQYAVDFVDPLCDLTHSTDQKSFFSQWKNKLEILLNQYDIFFGFSLGGVVFQQCFDLLKKQNKPLVLFSVPSFCDKTLSERLSKVRGLIEEESVFSAINKLNQWVFYPHDLPSQQLVLVNPDLSALRLSKGLQFVLETDSRSILSKMQVNHLHLVGEMSQLINRNNVMMTPSSRLAFVPQAGMRVIKDNSKYCVESIVDFLKGK